jgi:hypothetical protein
VVLPLPSCRYYRGHIRLHAERDPGYGVGWALLSQGASGFPYHNTSRHHGGQERRLSPAFAELQHDGSLPITCTLRQCKYLNNVIEQDHRFVKRRVNPGLGFGATLTAWCTIQGYEAMHMLRKGQLHGTTKGDILSQNRLIAQVFGLAA